jgi:uncharacterized protein (TIGR01777 family)
MKRVLVTGGTGFVGGRVIRALLERGDSVTVVTRSPERARGRLPNEVRLVSWDGTGDGGLEAAMAVDGVLHFAGEQVVGRRWSEALKREIADSRVKTTERLVAAMERAPSRPRVLVSASGVGWYGPRGDEPLDESGPLGSDFLASVTRDWEGAAERAESFGVRVVRVRLGIVFGKGGGALPEMVKPFKLFVGGPIASGKQVYSWLHLEDACAIFLRCLDDDSIRGPVNAASPNAVTSEELARALGRVLHRPSGFRVPEAALRIRFGEGADALVTGQRAVPSVLLAKGFSFRYPRVEDALAEALS